jgi:hypothetical protein
MSELEIAYNKLLQLGVVRQASVTDTLAMPSDRIAVAVYQTNGVAIPLQQDSEKSANGKLERHP